MRSLEHPGTCSLALLFFLARPIYGCQHPQDSESDLASLVHKLSKGINCDTTNSFSRSGGNGMPGVQHGGVPLEWEIRKAWVSLGNALMEGLGCEDHNRCPGQIACSQLVDQALKMPSPRKRSARHAPASSGRFAGDLDTYPIQDNHRVNLAEQLHQAAHGDTNDLHRRSPSEGQGRAQHAQDLLPQTGPLYMYDDVLDELEGQLKLSHLPEPEKYAQLQPGSVSNAAAVAVQPAFVQGQIVHPQGKIPGDAYLWLPPGQETQSRLQQDPMVGKVGAPGGSPAFSQKAKTAQNQFQANSQRDIGFQAAIQHAPNPWNANDNIGQTKKPDKITLSTKKAWNRDASRNGPSKPSDKSGPKETKISVEKTKIPVTSKHIKSSQNSSMVTTDVHRDQKHHGSQSLGNAGPKRQGERRSQGILKKRPKYARGESRNYPSSQRGGAARRQSGGRLRQQQGNNRQEGPRRTTRTLDLTTIEIVTKTQTQGLLRKNHEVPAHDSRSQATYVLHHSRPESTYPSISDHPPEKDAALTTQIAENSTDDEDSYTGQFYSQNNESSSQNNESSSQNNDTIGHISTSQYSLSPGLFSTVMTSTPEDRRTLQDTARTDSDTTATSEEVDALSAPTPGDSERENVAEIGSLLERFTTSTQTPETPSQSPETTRLSSTSPSQTPPSSVQETSAQSSTSTSEFSSSQYPFTPQSTLSIEKRSMGSLNVPMMPQYFLPINHSLVALNLVFAILGRTNQDCSRAEEHFVSAQSWVNKICSEVESSQSGIALVVQRAITSLEIKLLEALERWNPEIILRMADSRDSEDFLLQHQCFSIYLLATSAASSLHHVTGQSCHRDLVRFLTQLSTSIVIRLLQGQRHGSSREPCQVDFVNFILDNYGSQQNGCNNRRIISVEGLQRLLDDVHIKNCSSHENNFSAETFSSPSSDSHNDRSHDQPDNDHREPGSNRVKRTWFPTSQVFSASQLVQMILKNQTDSVSVQQFYQLCPSLLQQLLMSPEEGQTTPGENNHHSHKTEIDETIPASSLQTYGLGTAAVAVITLCSLFGALLVRLCRGIGRHYAMALMLGLAVGNLCGDAILHLLPEALGLASHRRSDHNGDSHHDDKDNGHEVYRLAGGFVVDDVRLKCLALLVSVYLFWLLEIWACRYYDLAHMAPDKGNVHFVSERRLNPEVGTSIPMSTLAEMSETTLPGQTFENRNPYDVVTSQGLYHNKPFAKNGGEFQESSRHLVWMIVVGDAVHNLADGLAIGVAFSHSIPLGLSTSMAVVCHEIPHELGDFAVLVSTGMKVKKALLFNLLSAMSAFVGLYIGLGVGAHESHRQWVFTAVAGMFLYVALADLIPELARCFRHFPNVHMFMAQNIGLLSGFALMFLLVLLEEILHF